MTKKQMAARIAELERDRDAWRAIAEARLPPHPALMPTVNALPLLGPHPLLYGCAHEYPTHMYVPPGGSIACMKCGQRSTVFGPSYTVTTGPVTSNGGHAS